MYMRAIATLALDAKSGFDSGDTLTSDALDLQKYFVNPGKREMKAVLSAIPTGSDSGTFDYLLQESNTSVDSDFSNITGASFTQVGVAADAATSTPEAIHFFTAKRWIRGSATIAGSTWAVTALVFAVKRDA